MYHFGLKAHLNEASPSNQDAHMEMTGIPEKPPTARDPLCANVTFFPSLSMLDYGEATEGPLNPFLPMTKIFISESFSVLFSLDVLGCYAASKPHFFFFVKEIISVLWGIKYRVIQYTSSEVLPQTFKDEVHQVTELFFLRED